MYGPDKKLMVDFMLRLENLDKDWPALMKHLNLDFNLPQLNVSSTELYQEHYLDETIVDAVTRRYIHDATNFDYTFM